jgi:ATP-binding protein involved in chromosome partitioning
MIKIAIPLSAGRLSAHFGHCEQFALFETDTSSKQIVGQMLATPPPHAPGVLPRWLQQQGVDVIIAGGMGGRAQSLFAENGIEIKTGIPDGTPQEQLNAFFDGNLSSGAAACHQHGHSCH